MKVHITSLFNKFTVIALLVALIGSAVQVTPVYAASIVVNTNTDTQANDGKCSLREAIIAANINARSGSLAGECVAGSSGADSIGFVNNSTITIGSQLPFVTTAMTITGKGAVNTIIQAAATPNTATWRVFQVTDTGNLTLDGVTVRNGRCNGSCTTVGGVEPNGGGGVYNSGTLTLTNSILSDSSGTLGGGIFNNGGTVIVAKSTISSNNSFQVTNEEDGGGGIRNTGTLIVTSSTISGNTAKAGAGIFNSDPIGGGAQLTVTSSTISGNTAAKYGGGMYNFSGDAIVTNSTVSGNNAGSGGGGILMFDSYMTMTNSTIAGNIAVDGGGIYRIGGGSTTLKNTIVSNNGGENCYVPISNDGNNLDSGSSCGFGFNNGSMSSTDPILGPLANNGGHTRTMALLVGSPVIDAGSDVNCPNTDQREGNRPQGSHCDIGAYEFGAPVTFVFSTFSDVPVSYWALSFLERLYAAGITGGCTTSPLQYCPEATVTRAQMAIFLERGMRGSSYTPPAVGGSTGFNDVPLAYWAGAWIKQLAADGITSGCGLGNYCPEGAVTRAQMAIFLLRSKHGAAYIPPDAGTGTGFSDVPPSYWAAAWIKQLVAEGITAGCGTGTYCPEASVTRAQMAVFLVRTFNLP